VNRYKTSPNPKHGIELENKPWFRTTTQQPNERVATFSRNPSSTRSGNLMDLYCSKCLKSTGDAQAICLVICGRSNGKPSEDILNTQGVEVPSLDVCLSWIENQINLINFTLAISTYSIEFS
jgi:hypothetical protein